MERVSAKDCRRDVQDEVRKTEERYRNLEIRERERERGEKERSETVIAKERATNGERRIGNWR